MRTVACRLPDPSRQRLVALLLLVGALLAGLPLAGCNTVAGMGEDLSAAGRAIEGSAERTERRM